MEELKDLNNFLNKHRRIGLDTNLFIYFIERHPIYFSSTQVIFKFIEDSNIKAAASTITMMELLVQPYKLQNDELILKFYALLSTYPNLHWLDLSLEIADNAAKIRAESSLGAPDAIQIASALAFGATGFLSNDPTFKKVKGMESFILKENI